jgi:hypothetical protein
VHLGLRAKLVQIKGYEELFVVDEHVTTGADSGEMAFISETAPNVHKVVVDKGSERGYVDITGGEVEAYFVRTSPDRTGVEIVELQNDQICTIHGCSTVLYIRRR